jgi:uncharacterized protein (DUF1499 family)
MLTFIAIAIAIIIAIFAGAYAGLGWWSHQSRFTVAGIAGERLAPCPASPNCVCSDHPGAGDDHAVAALRLPGGAAADHWSRITRLVTELGGTVHTDTGTYLHATFVSRFFRFVDDLELRADGESIQVRSASRVGYSDLGVNRKRVEALRHALGTRASG